MGKVTPELIRAQCLELRGVEITERRAQELAADVSRLNDAALGARDRLDFNDEPARFAGLLSASATPAKKRK